MDSTDSVVMGGQNKRDTLADMPRFGGRSVQESEVSPVWLNKELFKKVTQEKTKEYQTASSLRNFETCVNIQDTDLSI